MLPPSTTLSAIRLVRDTVTQVGKAVSGALDSDSLQPHSSGFAEALQSVDTAPPSSLAKSREQFSLAVNQSLSSLGISSNPLPSLTVQEDGEVRVDGNHPQAARIEAMINHDQGLSELAKQISRQAGGPVKIELQNSPDLTDLNSQIIIHTQRR